MDKWFSKIAAEYRLPDDLPRQLRDVGYVVTEGPVPRSKVGQLSEAYDKAVLAADPEDLSISTSTRVHGFVNVGSGFDELYLYPPVLAACCHIIGRPFKLSVLAARTLEPGAPAQDLHVDFQRDAEGWPMIGFVFMVDEFRSDNGATRFVPGSHLIPHAPADLMNDATAAYEGEALACGPAGSIIIYNGSIWHGFSANRSARRRRSIQGAFIRREACGWMDQKPRLRHATVSRLGGLAKYLLNVGTDDGPLR